MDNENNQPWPLVTIGQLRAKRSGMAHDWTPKDCLLDLIKAIDEGRVDPEGLIVCFYNVNDDNGVEIKFSQSMPNPLMAAGTLQRVGQMLGS